MPSREPYHRRPAAPGTPKRGFLRRSMVFSGILGLLLSAVLAMDLGHLADATAEDIRFFRIGTGSTSGTYFPIAGIIASAISSPPGSRSCDQGGSCGVPGLIAVAQSTNGSVDNVDAIGRGLLESGFVQADVAYWAYHGSGVFKDKGAIADLRAIANLYPESVHLVVRRDAGIASVRDLKGRRVSLDREGSGTKVDAELILMAYGLSPKDIEAHHVSVGVAIDMLRAGELDAFFFVAGSPAKAVSALAADSLISLVPINGAEADALTKDFPFFARHTIPAGSYFNVAATPTLSVGAQWMVSADADEQMVYEIARALWHPSTGTLLTQGHPTGSLILEESALDGIGVPLHPGAARYYEEASLKHPAAGE